MGSVFALASKVFGVISGPLNLLVLGYKAVVNFPSFWLLLRNIDNLNQIWDKSEKLVQDLYSHKISAREASTRGLEIIEQTINTGLIDIPNVDEKNLAINIHQVRESLNRQIVDTSVAINGQVVPHQVEANQPQVVTPPVVEAPKQDVVPQATEGDQNAK